MTFIGQAHSVNAGYFWNDNTASGGTHEKSDVQSCTHCQRVIIMNEWRAVDRGSGKMSGGFCIKCNAPICAYCNKDFAQNGCVPFIKLIDQHHDATIKLAQFRKLAGLDSPPAARALIVPGEHGS